MTTSMLPGRRIALDRGREPVAEPQARLVDGDAVHDRVGPREVDVLERARREARVRGALARDHLAVGGDEHGLAGGEVAHDLVVAGLEHERLARDDPLVAGQTRGPSPEHKRPDAERVTEGEHPVTGDEGDRRVGAFDALVQAADRGEHLVGVEILTTHLLLQLVSEHVDEQLGVAVGVEVPAVDLEQLARELARVREVAVVDEDDAVRRVHVERLGLLLLGGGAARRIPHMAEAHRAEQRAHVARAVGLAHLALRLDEVQHAPFGGRDAGRILAPMLQEGECVVDLLIDGARRDDPHDAAHAVPAPDRRVVTACDQSGRPQMG